VSRTKRTPTLVVVTKPMQIQLVRQLNVQLRLIDHVIGLSEHDSDRLRRDFVRETLRQEEAVARRLIAKLGGCEDTKRRPIHA